GGPVRSAELDAERASALASRNLYGRERVRFDAVKIVLDGVPTDGHTAAMVEPYADADDDDPRARGLLQFPQDELDRIVAEYDRQGLLVKFHSAGDQAVRAGLDAIAFARAANGYSGLRHEVGHNSFVQADDISRARKLGATFEMSPYIWYPHPIIPAIERAVGEERMRRWMPVRELLDAGVSVVPGSDSDWLDVRTVNPWVAIETLVTRRAPGDTGPALAEDQGITLEQAFDLFSIDAARQLGNGARTGRIEQGMIADVIVVDRDPFATPVEQIHTVQVTKTIIEGEIVFERDA
ncbi:MAG TPA: amidohydrolase family protein, partial [Microbacterium sp.]|nr:amidohydrolase family protein [Microbacterium sp.]